MAWIPSRAERLPGSEPRTVPVGFEPSHSARPPFGIHPNLSYRVLAEDGYRLLLDEHGGHEAVCRGIRISPGATPRFGCALFVEDRESGRGSWLHDLPGRWWNAASHTPGRLVETADFEGATLTFERFAVPGELSELCYLHLSDPRGLPRSFRLTLVRDIAFDPPDAFDSHPVFSKLFLQTERVETPPCLLLSRRPRSALESHSVLLFAPILVADDPQHLHAGDTAHAGDSAQTGGSAHAGVNDGASASPMNGACTLAVDGWCETDRAVILGRTLPFPGHIRVPRVEGTSGNILDPMLALRIDAHLDGTDGAQCAFLLSIADTRDAARSRLAEWQAPGRVSRARWDAESTGLARLRRLGLSPEEAGAFESLGAAVLAADATLRREAERTQAVARDQPRSVEPEDLQALATLGVSPNLPFVLARPTAMSAAERRDLDRALRYWLELGLGIHAVLLWDARRGTDDPHLATLAALPVAQLDASTVHPRILELLDTLARVTLPRRPTGERSPAADASSPELVWLHPDAPGTSQAGTDAMAEAAPAHAPGAQDALEFWNGWGGFAREGTEYVIRLRADDGGLPLPPRPWVNVLANPRFGCIVSETGAGTTWYGNSREHRITPWRNDPVLDPHDEVFYLLDEEDGQIFSAFPGPLPGAESYEIRHGFGYTSFRHDTLGMRVESLVFVAERDPFKVTRIRLQNPGPGTRRISVTSWARLVLGPSTGGAERFVVTQADPGCRALFARNPVSTGVRGAVVFATATARGVLVESSLTADGSSVLGTRQNPARPEGILKGRALNGATGAGLDPCFAQKLDFAIEAGDSAEVCFVLGAGADLEEATTLAAAFADPGKVERELLQVQESWRTLLAGLQVETPSRGLDLMVNGWLPYQTIACRIWGRSAFYQSGGAFGFRDQLQDASSLVHLDPARTREQILLHGRHQFEDGDVLHWWHPPEDVGIRTRFVDDLLWLPLLTASYVEYTGDAQILDEPLPLLSAPALEEGEAERFLRPTPAGRTVDLYEHCCLAIDRSLHKGPHGLPLFGSGDWNDGMNRVGIGGTGESVWMGFFVVSVLDAFLPFVTARGETDRAGRYGRHREEIIAAVETAGWDGEWYRRGYFDDGSPLGSRENDECRIDVLAQAWAVISGVASPGRVSQALDAAERELVSEHEGIIRLLTPAFANSAHDPGYIKGYVAGVRENGGQYTHAALWLIRALAEAGRRERVAPLLDMVNPVHLSSGPEKVTRYQLEPYVVAADVYGVDPHVGRGGWSWYTGSSGWMSRVAIESLLGFTVSLGREARVAPVIPDEWPGFTIRYRPPAGDTIYEIRVENPERRSETVLSAHCPELGATVRDGAAVFRLEDDGGLHVVRIRMGPRDGAREVRP